MMDGESDDSSATAPRVLVSYSHDHPEHAARVLALSERLREDGINALLDRYINGTPTQGWPRWMLDEIDRATFVLLICTEIYYRRFRGHEVLRTGKGADWEGATITQTIYDARSATAKFVPVVFGAADIIFIPEPVRSHTYYDVTAAAGYDALLAYLSGVGGVQPRAVTMAKSHGTKTAILAHDTSRPENNGAHPTNFSVYQEDGPSQAEIRVPQFHYGGVVPPEYFIGRADELAEAEEIVRSKQSFLLVGERRAGKTSFCDALIHRVMGAPGNQILVGKINLESCENLTISTFLSHTLLSMLGEIARQVFGFPYSALLSSRPPTERPNSLDSAFYALADMRRVVGERAHSEREAGAIALVPQDFQRLTAELLDLIAVKGWSEYLMIYDEANRLATDLSVSLLMTHLEVLNSSRLITAYAASPEMAGSFGPLAKHLLCKVRLGPFRSNTEMRKLLGRYYYDDASRTRDLPITAEAERLVWDISAGMPFRIQCLFAYGFANARRGHHHRVDVGHIEEALRDLRRDLPEYFQRRGQ
jgi:hypothetical protein